MYCLGLDGAVLIALTQRSTLQFLRALMLSANAPNLFVLRVSRWKSGALFVITTLFTYGAAYEGLLLWQWPPQTLFSCLLGIFSVLGLGASTWVAVRLRSPPELLVSPQGLILRNHGKERRWDWTDISKFDLIQGPLQETHVVVRSGSPNSKSETASTILPWGLAAGPWALRRTLSAAHGAALSAGQEDFYTAVSASTAKVKYGVSIDTVRILLVLACIGFVAYAFMSKPRPDEVQLRCGHAYRFSASRAQLRMAFNTDGCPTVEDVEKQRIRPFEERTQQ